LSAVETSFLHSHALKLIGGNFVLSEVRGLDWTQKQSTIYKDKVAYHFP